MFDDKCTRKHLKEDILPYTCVLPRCPKPGTLFAEKSAWLDHMFTDHIASASWVCDICGNTETFTTESDSITHLTDLHQDAIPADQVTLFAELCYKRTTAEISSCPLCSWAEDADGYITNEQLLEHVAEHIHSFALRSLPWAPDKDDHDRNTFERAFEKVEDWFAKCNPDAESSGYKSKLPSAELRENADNYFLTHEYFGESSRASSLAPTLSSVGWDDDVDEDEDESEEHSQSALSFDSGSDRSDNAEDERHDKTQRAIPVSGPQYPRSPITIKVIDDHGQRIFIDPPSPQLAPKPSVDDYHSDESDVNYVRERSTRGSAHVDMDRPLPSCPRSTATTSYDDWYTLQGRHNFDICPSCYEGVFDGTPFAVDFSQTRRGERPTERFCDFSSPWTRLAWLLTIKQRRSSLDLLHAIADITETDRPCPDNVELRSDRITWYGIPDQRDGVHVANFAVCSADKKMVEALLPTMRGYFTRLPTSYASSTLPKYMCSLRTSSRRFPKYLDLLITLDSEAQDLAQRPNINRFSQLARDNALKSECTRDKVFSRKPWMFIPSVPEFTVCEECYDELIRPAYQSKSTATTIPRPFNKTMQLVPEEDLETGASCCLYSSRMRKVFDISIKETDLPYLRRKAVERKKTRTKLTRERKQIVNRMLDLDKGSSQWERAKNEIEALDREWATWE